MVSVGLRPSLLPTGPREESGSGPTMGDSVFPFAAAPNLSMGASATASPRVLVTIPVRNEMVRLEATVEALDKAFRATPFNYQLSVAEDGSTDGTKEMLRGFPTRWPNLLIQEEADSLGRGRALRQLWSHTSADVYCFTDADLAAGAPVLVRAVEKVVAGEPVVVGSRYLPGASTTRPLVRSLVSRGYNRLLRFAFDEEIRDHQCGLKAFSAAAIQELLPRTLEDSWFWDTEILILALERGIPVLELPVTWVERKSSRTQYQRLLSDFVLHGTGILRLKSRVRSLRPRPAWPPSIFSAAPALDRRTSLPRPRQPRTGFGIAVPPAPEFSLPRSAEESK
jgi:hypothetical protein